MSTYFNLAMIVVSVVLIALVVLQSRSAGLGGLSGGDFGGSGYHVKRGVERLLFNVTIGLSVVFFLLSVLTVILVG